MQQKTYRTTVGTADAAGPVRRDGTPDWSGEITPTARMRSPVDTGMGGMAGRTQADTQNEAMESGMPDSRMPRELSRPAQRWERTDMQARQDHTLDMRHGLSDEVIESPMSNAEVYAGSAKAMLRRNLGNYVVATFLIGTQNTVSWEGVLYDVGNDYVTIYQPGRDRYIVNDIYSLKYTEFYDVRRRQLCDQLMRDQGWDVGETWPPSR